MKLTYELNIKYRKTERGIKLDENIKTIVFLW